MEPDLWRRVQQILEDTEGKQAPERAAVLDKACGEDTELRRSVEKIFASLDMTDDFLGIAVGQAASVLMDSIQSPAKPGQSLGPYRILRQLGAGGMGSVYLAERADDQYHKLVAIKLINTASGPDSATELRFRTERQILAQLEHPNIARLLDGGASESGSPYVVMEYIEGVPVGEYVRSKDLPIAERIGLFLSICNAVAYAHRNLVVHRDIKPSNILVTAEGVPKLLDFGIAKLLSVEPAQGSGGHTRSTQWLMTPDFASPEQIRGETVTTATDIYSLGVLLYVLLAGRAPYRTEGRSPAEIERLISAQDCERPSSAVADARLKRELSGDLDQIVAMAMRSDPAARYGSVGTLMEDLQRYLDGYPVAARKGVWTYIISKFVRRHRVAVLVGGMLIVLILAFGVSMAALARKIQFERDASERERRTEQQVSQFLVKLFESSNTDQSGGHLPTARDLLDHGVASVDKDLGAQPELHARMLEVMGLAYESLGVYEESEPLLERSLAIRKTLGGGRTLVTAESLKDLSETLRLRSKYAEAEKAARESLSIRSAILGTENIDAAESLNTIGLILWQKGDPASAEPFVRQALAIRTRLEGSDSIGAAVYMSNLAGIRRTRNDLSEAETLYRKVVDLRSRKLGLDHPRTAISLNGLALVLLARGSYNESEDLMRQILASRRRVLGESHPDVFTTQNDLAQVLLRQAKYDEARDISQKLLAAEIAIDGEATHRAAFCLNVLGDVEEETGRYQEALAHNRRSLETRRKVFGERSTWYARSLADTAQVLLDRADLKQAETLAQESLRIRRDVLGPKHMETASASLLLGHIEQAAHRLNAAESLYRDALAVDAAVLDQNHPARADALNLLGGLLIERGRPREAEPLLREALLIRRARLAPNHWATASTASLLGACLTALQGYEEAGQLLTESANALDRWRAVRRRDWSEARAKLDQWRSLSRRH
jgi:eukaryotic-like serine/threonine-protein kinase